MRAVRAVGVVGGGEGGGGGRGILGRARHQSVWAVGVGVVRAVRACGGVGMHWQPLNTLI